MDALVQLPMGEGDAIIEEIKDTINQTPLLQTSRQDRRLYLVPSRETCQKFCIESIKLGE